jgi:hypothetical protein
MCVDSAPNLARIRPGLFLLAPIGLIPYCATAEILRQPIKEQADVNHC